MRIDNESRLEFWLKNKPIEWAQIVALRSALRALPFLLQQSSNLLTNHSLVVFRALCTAWSAQSVPAHSTVSAANAAAEDGIELCDEFTANDPTYTSVLHAALAVADGNNAAKHAADAAKAAVDAATELVETPDNINEIFFSAVSNDCERLQSWEEEIRSSYVMTGRRLWPGQQPEWWLARLQLFFDKLLELDQGFEVWIDWYLRRVRGEWSAFNIPNDSKRKEDKAVLIRLAESTDDDFWFEDVSFVNATLKEWLETAIDHATQDSQYANEAPSPEELAETLLQQASPQAQITDGKLDAAPNTTFDKPQYSDNLAELPSELLAYTNTILNSLPTNCSAIVRNCFTGFRDEMLVRGNRPILNILKAMAASLTVELYGNPPADTSPDEWQLRDPREWGDGFHSMFGHFFKGYHDLIHHFPLDTEREDFIAATPIDEMAASGEALTGPVDAVAALILELGKQGFATDNIVRIIEAHQIYNRDIAQLPSPGADSNVVTPKRRHVLATAGFYLNTYSVLGTTASLYALQTVPAVQALMPKLKAAADALLAFIR